MTGVTTLSSYMLSIRHIVAAVLFCTIINLRVEHVNLMSISTLKKSVVAGHRVMATSYSLWSRQTIVSGSINISTAQSKLTCSSHQCMLEDACIDSTMKQFKHGPRFNIRLLGSDQVLLDDMQRRFLDTMGGRDKATLYAEPIDWNNASSVPKDLPIEIHLTTSTAIVNRFVQSNCGHALGDGAFPIFRLMRTFQHAGTTLSDLYINSNRKTRCDDYYRALTKTGNFSWQRKRPRTTQCFGRIYAGVQGISFMSEYGVSDERLPTLQDDMKAFRDTLYENLDIPKPDSVNRVLVLTKKAGKTMANFENLDEIVATIQSKFPFYNVSVVSWPDYSFKEQLELLRSTKVMVSLPGAATLNAIFMPNYSLLWMFCRLRLHQKIPNTSVFDENNDYEYWFRHVSHIQTLSEDCNSTRVSYNWAGSLTTKVEDLQYLTDVLSRHADASKV